MKTDTLKFKAVMLAIALASTSPTVIVPMDAADTTQVDYQNQFIEAMFTQIRDGVTATIDLVESFIDKTNTESSVPLLSAAMIRWYISKTIF